MTIKVTIDIVKGRYRLRLPRAYVVNGKRYFYTKLKATEENRPEAERLAALLVDQLAQGLTPTLSTYSPYDIWELYLEYKKPTIAETTYLRLERDMGSHIRKLPSENAQEVAEYLATKTVRVARRVATNLKAAYAYAVSQGIVADNPYLALDIPGRIPKPEVDPFTAKERDGILEAFQKHPRYAHYVTFVKFLFMTGCRLGEAVAMQWNQVMPDYQAIWINASYNSEFRIRKTTKTNKPRRFPCSPKLQVLLRDMDNLPHTELLFTHHRRDGYISGHTFAKAVWRKVLQPLIDSGQVERYRVPYNCRHTWATMALESGMTIAEVAKYLGSSPSVVQMYYFGVSRDRPMPDF